MPPLLLLLSLRLLALLQGRLLALAAPGRRQRVFSLVWHWGLELHLRKPGALQGTGACFTVRPDTCDEPTTEPPSEAATLSSKHAPVETCVV